MSPTEPSRNFLVRCCLMYLYYEHKFAISTQILALMVRGATTKVARSLLLRGSSSRMART